MHSSSRSPLLWRALLAISLAISLGAAAPGCRREEQRAGAYRVNGSADCLPDITLTDQNGKKVSLSSLKGKPVLFDFIYTTCPGPCLTLTSRMRTVANRLGPMLGSKVWFVSVTVDPEHDNPARLLDYARQLGADQNGWLFLTGSPADIDRLMAQFKLVRQRESDGSVDHVLEFFLVGPDGRQLYQYVGSRADASTIARDLEQAAQAGAVASGRPWSVHL